MRKVNSVVAILKLLAVFVLLTDLAFITFFSDSFSLVTEIFHPLFFFVDFLLIIGIACSSTLCEDLDENRSRISGWLVVNVFLWGLSVVLLKKQYL